MADDRKVAFNWYLNRQGPRGPQGVKGDTGFSPNITVETDTLNEYILRITNEGGYFLTSNLREHKEDRGGTYIRYDRENGTMYAGEADTATDAKAGMIKIATAEDVEAEDESTAVTPAILADYVAGIGGAPIDDTTVSSSKVWSSEKTSQSIAAVSNQVTANTTDISNIKTALPNKQNKLTAGTNITIEGDVISATGSGSGDVTLAGNNYFTGNNTFTGATKFDNDVNIHGANLEVAGVLDATSAKITNLQVPNTLTSSGEINAVSIKAAGIVNNQNGKHYLTQASITAGTNVAIEETTEGVKISATGGGGSEPPSNMMTTDTTQADLSGTKYWVSGAKLGIGSGLILDENFVNVAGGKLDISKQVVDGFEDTPVIHTSSPYIVLSARQKIKFNYDGSTGYYDILDSSHLGDYVDGTTITYTNNKLTAVGGGGSVDIAANLPLKIVNGVISLDVDGQTIQIVDGKLHANLDELGNEVNTLAGDISSVQADLTKKQDKLTAGSNITISTDNIISATGVLSSEKHGLEGDYCSRYGIVDCPNGILEEGTGQVTLKAGVVMQMTETDGLTTNASDMSHTITSTVDFDLFYTSGSLLEATKVIFSEQEPEDGVTGVLAWYNGTKWQFKSNDEGNVWRAAPAVRLAHCHITDGNITRIDYIGNRHLNKVIPVTTDTAQIITGAKTFSNEINVSTVKGQSGNIISRESISNGIVFGNTEQTIRISGLSVLDKNNRKFLTQSTVTAGSNNLTISETLHGIQVTCDSPTNAQFATLQDTVATKTTMVQAAQASMPSERAIDLTLGASGSTYTAPADGYFTIRKFGTSAYQFIGLYGAVTSEVVCPIQNFDAAVYIPAAKGQSVACYYSLAGETKEFKFVYAVGSEPST